MQSSTTQLDLSSMFGSFIMKSRLWRTYSTAGVVVSIDWYTDSFIC